MNSGTRALAENLPPPAAGDDESAVISMRGITKRFGDIIANDGVDLTLRRGEILALLGENGAGKTTLMNILFGHYSPDEGEIIAFGRRLSQVSTRAARQLGINMVHQHFALVDHHTVLENVILGTERLFQLRHEKNAARARASAIAGEFHLAIDLDAPVGNLSVGEQQRVEILKSLYANASVLILDEPTAVLTPQQTEGLFRTLRRFVEGGRSAIIISHKLREVLTVSDRVHVLRGGRTVGVLETPKANRDALAELMVGRALKGPRRSEREPGPPALELRRVTVRDGAGRARLVGASVTVCSGEILGVAGVAGNGQGALADVAAGLLELSEGKLVVAGREVRGGDPNAVIAAGVGRIPEDRIGTGLLGDRPLWENVVLYDHAAYARMGFISHRRVRQRTEALIEEYDIKGARWTTQTRLLSGGNLQKVLIARELARKPAVLVASQPSRGLDVGAIEFLHARLLDARESGTAILLISEDLDEVQALSDRIVVIFEGRVTEPMPTTEVTRARLGLLMAGHVANGQESG